MKHIQSYTKLFEKKEPTIEDIYDLMDKSGNYDEDDKEMAARLLSDSYYGWDGGDPGGKIAPDFGMSFKFVAHVDGKNTKVILIEEGEHDSYYELLGFVVGKNISYKRNNNDVLEGTYTPDYGTLELRGIIPKDALDVIVNCYVNILGTRFTNGLIIDIGSWGHDYSTVNQVPYKDYVYSDIDNSLSILHKILSMYKQDAFLDDDGKLVHSKLLQDFDIVSAVSPLPNDIRSKVIDKFNKMFKKKSLVNMKIRVLPKGMTQAEYNHKKTKYKFTESKDIEI